jgi:cation diffusion facilitator CzcD-associated flavoprotein CzcO
MTQSKRAGDVDCRIAIIGAGCSGIATAIRLRRIGIDDFVVLERGPTVGGTWRDNDYPGCACDVPSSVYELSFATKHDWRSAFATGPEIQSYLLDCVRTNGLESHIALGREVERLRWQPDRGRWRIESRGDALAARVVVLATGPLSQPAIPRLPGLRAFGGAAFHSARWQHQHDLRGARVAVVGSGASAAQIVPELAEIAGELHVYQRTPPWVLPRRDRSLTAIEHAIYGALPAVRRARRAAAYWGRELAYPVFRSATAGHVAERISLRHLEAQIADPALREALRPPYRLGCKRVLLSSHYYPALTRPHVTLIPHAVRQVTATGLVAADGVERPADVIVFATGFAIGAALPPQRIHGREGTLADCWAAGPSAYNGTTVAGFPNLAILLGPHTGLAHNSVLVMVEAQIIYLLGMIEALERMGLRSLEPDTRAQSRYADWIRARSNRLVFERGGCQSWYLDAGGHSILWPGPSWRFTRRLRRFDIENYIADVDAGSHVFSAY